MAPEWLKKAVFYEIYPQTFYSPESEGCGTLQGIISRFDYIKDLGCDAIWLNPIYDSPFKDAGYDVRDYKKVAKRYGSNEDAKELFEKAHEKGMHVILDLVPGHTSEEHEWFKASSRAEKNEYSGRYVWTDSWFKGIAGRPYIGGECERDGTYMLNFFKCQPALNYGWLNPSESWQSAMDSPEALATREAMKDVCRFWLKLGCDGFRVDMADSLVKGDDEKHATAEVWRDILGDVKRDYPDSAFVSEWSNPYISVGEAGFDMDFFLDHPGNGYNFLLRDYETSGEDRSYFRSSSKVSCRRFINDYVPMYEAIRGKGYISLISGNHDTVRLSHSLSDRERKVALAFILTMPGVPFLYYGDEIGMRYLDLPTLEGGYTRTGTRSPMQWDDKTLTAGREGKLYLPCDPSNDAPTVEGQKKVADSIFNIVKSLISLRRGDSSLQADSPFEVLFCSDDSPLLVYRRGDLKVAVNPSSDEASAWLDIGTGKTIWSIGEGKCEEGMIRLKPQSFVIFK
ncbi:MAG: glycosylase [Clostridiales bacterium]|nr:glycosylase [Clostridiales bacterium]